MSMSQTIFLNAKVRMLYQSQTKLVNLISLKNKGKFSKTQSAIFTNYFEKDQQCPNVLFFPNVFPEVT